MEGKVLRWILLVGLALLVPRGQATNHGSGDGDPQGMVLPDGCEESVVRQCVNPFAPSGILAPFANDNATFDNTTDLSDLETWMQVCGAMKGVVECLEPQERQCFNSSQTVDFDSLLHLNFTVPPFSSVLVEWRDLCTNDKFCFIKENNCMMAHKDIIQELGSPITNLTNATCQKVAEAEECFGPHMPRRCRAAPAVYAYQKQFKKHSGLCGQRKCQTLVQCAETLTTGSAGLVGLKERNCFLYRNYTRCAADIVASSSCSDLPRIQGDPDLANVSDILDETCTAMSQEGINALYTCQNFTDCVSPPLAADTTFLPRICPAMQAMIGCALKTASACPGLNATMVPAFLAQMTAFSFRGQGLGCGSAEVQTHQCSALNACAGQLQAGAQTSDAMVKCSSSYNSQRCADNAAKSCNLTGPASPKVPELETLSNITRDICSAMQNESVLECPEFLTCMERLVIPPSADRQIINGQVWCRFNVGIMECIQYFSRTCNVSDTLMNAAENIYQDLLSEGCFNIYDHVIPPPPTTTTTEATGGAQPLVGASLMTLLLLACLHLL